MPRFFFHTADGGVELDHDGVELADTDSARIEAVRTLGAVLEDEAQTFLEGDALSMSVTDEAGRTILTLVVNAIDGVAAAR